MLRTIKLSCVSCGGGLDISEDMSRFACGYCGVEQIVERSGGTVALKAVTDAISKVQIGTDKTAAELALNRLPYELDSLLRQRWQREEQVKREIMLQSRRPSDSFFMIIMGGGAGVFFIVLFLAIVFKNTIVILVHHHSESDECSLK